MKIKQFVTGALPTNSYLVYDKGEAILIDCGGEEETILKFLKKHPIKLKYILLTHGHFDHIEVHKILKETKAKLGIHKKDSLMLRHPANLSYNDMEPIHEDFNIHGGDIFRISNTELEVIETPGHSPGGICFYSEKSKILFSGDTLFKKAIGRTDLPLSNEKDMIKSLKRLMKLKDDIQVYPGHGDQTTIGKERPYFS